MTLVLLPIIRRDSYFQPEESNLIFKHCQLIGLENDSQLKSLKKTALQDHSHLEAFGRHQPPT